MTVASVRERSLPHRRSRPFSALARVELLMFLREPFAVFFTLLLPVALQLVFAAAFGEYDVEGVPTSSLQLAGITVIVASYLGLMGIPIVMAEYREAGVIRSMRIVPIRFRSFVLAHVSVEVLMFLTSVTLCVLATAAIFGLVFRGSVAAFLLLVAAELFTFLSLGFAIASLGTSPRTSQAIGAFLYFFFLFTSGASVPRDQFPEGLQVVLDKLPVSMLLDRLQDVWIGRFEWRSTVVAVSALTVVGSVAALVAVRGFDTTAGRTA